MKVIAEDLWFPEGPVWVGDGSLLVVEARRKTLTRIWLDGRKEIVADLGGGPNGAAIGPDGHCYVANNGGSRFIPRADGYWVSAGAADDYVGGSIQRVDLKTGKVELLHTSVAGRRLNSPNDIVFDERGGFWFTDSGKKRARDFDHGSVCYVSHDGAVVEEVIFPIHKPNGIGLSPDGKTLYVSETESTRVYAWDIVAPGELAPPAPDAHLRPPHGGRLVYGSPTYARFDSLAVEAGGKVCVGTLITGGITVIDPATGTAQFVQVPGDAHLTNICFGGAGLTKAYLTQSHAGRLVEVDWPRAGLPLNY